MTVGNFANVTLTFNDTPQYFEVSDWWWEDDLLCLVLKDGTREYFNRKQISHLKVPKSKMGSEL